MFAASTVVQVVSTTSVEEGKCRSEETSSQRGESQQIETGEVDSEGSRFSESQGVMALADGGGDSLSRLASIVSWDIFP